MCRLKSAVNKNHNCLHTKKNKELLTKIYVDVVITGECRAVDACLNGKSIEFSLVVCILCAVHAFVGFSMCKSRAMHPIFSKDFKWRHKNKDRINLFLDAKSGHLHNLHS